MQYADEYATALTPRRYEADERTPADDVAAHPDTAGFHAKMREEGQFGSTPLVYADWIEEYGMPAAANIIRQHADTYRHGHTWLRGTYGPQGVANVPAGGFAAEAMTLPHDLGITDAENDEYRRKYDNHKLVQLHQRDTRPPHPTSGYTGFFSWAVPIPKDHLTDLFHALESEGVVTRRDGF